jgi:hypothetical protein
MTFARGAKIKPLDERLTISEAAFVTLSLMEKHGMTDYDEVIKYMTRAWKAYQEAGSPASGGADGG